jgi:hypothetical protein
MTAPPPGTWKGLLKHDRGPRGVVGFSLALHYAVLKCVLAVVSHIENITIEEMEGMMLLLRLSCLTPSNGYRPLAFYCRLLDRIYLGNLPQVKSPRFPDGYYNSVV